MNPSRPIGASGFSRLGICIREFGLREAVGRAGVWLVTHTFPSIFHQRDLPSLGALHAAALSVNCSAEEIIRELVIPRHDDGQINRLRTEYGELWLQLMERYRKVRLLYGAEYAIEDGSSFLLYALVRIRQPDVVLETGVADGHSSFFILNAILANDRGCLHSVDISQDVGSLLGERERQKWHLHLLTNSGWKRSFNNILMELPHIDLFFHDSDHSYQWLSYELYSVSKKMSQDAPLASDDCGSSYAFIDFCRATGFAPLFLLDKRKVFGVAFKQRLANHELDKPNGKYVNTD
jgi:hypothetical protein